MENPHIVRKTADPTSAPPEAGIHWINTSTGEEFFSVGTSSVDDWLQRTDGGGGVTDHGSLTGLSDDDHTQYHNDTRGDARYYTKSQADAAFQPDGFIDPAVIRSVSRGIIEGGEVTVNADTAKFNISAGSGIIVDNWTDVNNPVIIPVSWSAFTAQTTTYLASHSESFIAIDDTGAVFQSSAALTPSQRRDYLPLAKLAHNGNTAINNISSIPDVSESPHAQFGDLLDFLGLVNLGNIISANGANLSINKSLGYLMSRGINYGNDVKNPHIKTYSSGAAITTQYRTQTGVSTSDSTFLIPGSYDASGVVTAIPGSNSRASVQRIYLLSTGNLRIQYGQAWYTSLALAVNAATSEAFTVFPNISTSGILIGLVAMVKNATALNDPLQASFIPVSRFGEALTGTSSVTTATLQDSYNNSSDPEVLTDSTNGALSIRRGSGADTDTILEGRSGAGSTTFSVSGSGNIVAGTYNSYTPESTSNKATSTSLGTSDTLYPTQNAVKSYVDTSLALKAPLASPTFTGTPAAPTAAANTNTTQVATTAYADAKVANNITASTTVAPSKTQMITSLALKLNLTGGTMTGAIVNNGNIASDYDAYIVNNLNTAGYARMVAKNNLGEVFALAMSNTSAAAYGAIAPGEAHLYANRSMTLMSDVSGGVIKFATNGSTETSRISTDGTHVIDGIRSSVFKGVKGSDQTTTLDTLANITNMGFAVAASKKYIFEFLLRNGCNNTGGISFAITVPSGSSFVAVVEGTSAGVANRTSALLGTSGVGTAALYNVVNSTGGWTKIWGSVTTSGTAGTLQLQYASGTAGQTSSIYASSFYTAHEVA